MDEQPLRTENSFLSGLRTHFSEGQIRRLQSACVGIAGAGGLGSNCAVHLVRSGIQQLVLVDFDVVEPSNLNRQFYFLNQIGTKKVVALTENLKRINPDLSIEALDRRLEAQNVKNVFEPFEIIVEALDGAEEKKMMAEAFLRGPKFLVSASGVGGWGNSNRIKTRKIGDHFFLVGDDRSEVSETLPPTASITGLAAAKQADLVIECILENANYIN